MNWLPYCFSFLLLIPAVKSFSCVKIVTLLMRARVRYLVAMNNIRNLQESYKREIIQSMLIKEEYELLMRSAEWIEKKGLFRRKQSLDRPAEGGSAHEVSVKFGVLIKTCVVLNVDRVY